MEEYKTFTGRIKKLQPRGKFELDKKYFPIHPSVRMKVGSNNQFKSFYGDTTVFNLEREDKAKISPIISKLYEVAPECFSQRLQESMLHMTLHDLSSSQNYEDVKEDVKKNETKIKDILKVVSITPNTIRMRTKFITNILNISLALVFTPINEEEYNKLITIYHLLDLVRELDYFLTPHVTLGYYNIEGFDVASVKKLENLVRDLNKESFEITLSTDKLVYQTFSSMNAYTDVFKLA